MPITWKRLQEENDAWATKNFGKDRSAQWPLWGLLEELGELTHARLKREQGIRGSAEEHLTAEKDAIADSMIFFADVCNTQKWDMAELLRTETPEEFQKTYGLAEGKKPITQAVRYLSQIMEAHDLAEVSVFPDQSVVYRSAAKGFVLYYLGALSAYCTEQGWSLQTLIDDVWEVVKKRDWTKNKQNGGEAPVERTGDTVTLELKPAPRKKGG